MEKFFLNRELVINSKGHKLSKKEVELSIPLDFNGKDNFIEFYIAYNGISFPNSAFFYRELFYNVSEDDCNFLSVESFLPINDANDIINIWNMTKENIRVQKFAQVHIPFSVDASGNFFWIEIPTGHIKYIPMETPNEEILVAPSFVDFCENIQPTMR